MARADFDSSKGLGLIEELFGGAHSAASDDEICGRGLSLLASALGAAGGAVFLLGTPPERGAVAPLRLAASLGTGPESLLSLASDALAGREACVLRDEPRASARVRGPSVSLLMECGSQVVGALVLDGAEIWGSEARTVGLAAVRILASAVLVSHSLAESRRHGTLLAQRNNELEALRELSAFIQEARTEEEVLQIALERVLQRLGLEFGWIFWGEASRGTLELAASCGLSEAFVRTSKTSGIGSCLCRDVFATGVLKYARNTMDCPRLPDIVKADGPIAHACIPLKFERDVLGVMNIVNRPGQVFEPAELHFLEIVGNQICLAVDTLRTKRDEARHDEEARALVSLARALGGSLEQERVLATVGDHAREFLGADRCAIFLGDNPSSMEFAFLSGPSIVGLERGRKADMAAMLGAALVVALSQGQPLVIQDASEGAGAGHQDAGAWSLGSEIAVPLVARDRTEGLLLAGRGAASPWGADDLRLAEALTRQAAVAIDNARLYREAQDALLRLRRAEHGMMKAERMAAVGTLTSSLAHEVRNPLNSINLQLVLLSRRLGALDNPCRADLSALLDAAKQEIERLDALVEEFLSLSTIDRVSLSEADPVTVVREVIGLMEPLARQSGVVLKEVTGSHIPPIAMDRERIKQVLMSLVRNSLDAMPGGGSLIISIHAREGGVVIGVADTGHGIEAGIDVFDFFLTTKRGGTGLGLPIARRIVEAHGGTLAYESAPGRGTSFFMTLKGPGGAAEPGV